MTLTASHRDLDLDVLEQLASGAHSLGSTVVEDSPEITGCVVLATCNRFEVYVSTSTPTGPTGAGPTEGALDRVRRAVTGAVARTSGMSVADVEASLQPRVGPDVTRHLFTVASGLDSMVVGEREVAGQVRRALQTARTDGTTSAALERLFQTASRTSRAVGAGTALGATGRSVVGVALDLVGHEVDLPSARVLLIGTGSYAGASLTALRARGVRDVAVHSPSGRAQAFAADRGLEAVAPGDLDAQLARADVVVSCSGALGPVVDAPMVAAARARSGGEGGTPRPTVLVDLALRHDIDPTVGHLPGVRLIDLACVQQHSPSTVSPAVDAGLRIVADRAEEFEAALAELSVTPAVVALREHVQAVLEAELDRTRSRGGEGSDDVERALRRFAATMLHTPAVRAREHARGGRHTEYREAVEVVFGIEVPDDVAPDDVPPDDARRDETRLQGPSPT
ncbi:glutamyl-tRNA reductase [Actinotalea sp. K2]|uniref:glutamyl-tRNA reductase n=1 Tax=Actinotalea sp. K2 TaxID=2939438 RepID=UPI0020175E8B|nr:glutamyl-tRNA reductase [Actinotalea sp. K2]MCL3861643.1 glutamyl-tRNA reductase [Actinotalea sp. K2]